MTLTLCADLLTIAGAVLGPLLAYRGRGACMAPSRHGLSVCGPTLPSWMKRLRAELAKLDERQRADTAGLRTRMAKLDERQRADTTSLLAHMARLDERQRADAAKLEKRLRAELAKLDERQRADTAGLRTHMAKLDERQRADTTSLLAHIAKLDERQRADTAAINMRLDTLTQTIITSTIARGPEADLAAERGRQAVPTSTAEQS